MCVGVPGVEAFERSCFLVVLRILGFRVYRQGLIKS